MKPSLGQSHLSSNLVFGTWRWQFGFVLNAYPGRLTYVAYGAQSAIAIHSVNAELRAFIGTPPGVISLQAWRLFGRRILPLLPALIHSPNRRWPGGRSSPFWWSWLSCGAPYRKRPGVCPAAPGRSVGCCSDSGRPAAVENSCNKRQAVTKNPAPMRLMVPRQQRVRFLLYTPYSSATLADRSRVS